MRYCTHCGEPMYSGYVIYDGEEYYCDEPCLHEHYTEKEYLEMYDNDEAYWTMWEEDEEEEENNG